MLRTISRPRSTCMTITRLALLGLALLGLGACTHLDGAREAYLHSRQITVEMDVASAAEPVTRVAAWPGPEFNLTLVRGDTLFPSELAQATAERSLTDGSTLP